MLPLMMSSAITTTAFSSANAQSNRLLERSCLLPFGPYGKLPHMQEGRRFIVKVLLGLVALICVQTLWYVAHALGYRPEEFLGRLVLSVPTPEALQMIQLLSVLALTAAVFMVVDWLVYRRGAEGVTTGKASRQATLSSDLNLPYDVDGRSALLFAANRTWVRKRHNEPVAGDTAQELQRVFDALERFYESASHEGGLRVWGRTSMSRPHKIIERTHWQDWHIDYTTFFADPNADPVRTVPRDRVPADSSPYYDIRLNRAEVEIVWPPEQSDIFLPIQEASRICFEETGLFGDEPDGGGLRLYQFVVLLVVEGNRNPDLLSVWGMQLPARRMTRIPPERLVVRDLREKGTEIHSNLAPMPISPDWVNVSVRRDELPQFIERLRRSETAGQQPAS